MGFLGKLKEKLLPKEEPFPWDAQSLRHRIFTLRLPEGWRFSKADWRSAVAAGPAGQAIELYYTVTEPDARYTAEQAESIRPKVLEMMRGLVRYDAQLKATPTQSVLPNGVLWTEASETKGTEQRFVFYLTNLVLREPEYRERSATICLRTSLPVASGALGSERLETLRGVLRSVEWN